MVGVFGRSLSTPSRINPNRPSPHHARSISLPCRPHPLISQLKDEVGELKTRLDSADENRTTAWLCDRLRRLSAVLEHLDDLLQCPQTAESLGRRPDFVEKLLEDFLRFADAFGIFRTSILGLKEAHQAAQVNIRRKDHSKIVYYIRAQKKIAKEMKHLVSTIRCLGRSDFNSQDEVTAVIEQVIEVIISISIALFNGVSLSSGSRKFAWIGPKVKAEGVEDLKGIGAKKLLKKGGDEEELRATLKRMKNLEESVCCIERGSERIFRGLIGVRVSLLNILTHRRD